MAVPIIVGTIIGGLLQGVGHIVGRVLVSLGIGIVSYTGVMTSLTFVKDHFVTSVGGLPPLALQIAGTLKIGVIVSILLSALAARLTFSGLSGDTLKRWTTGGGV